MLWWSLWRIKSKKSETRARATRKLGSSKDPRAFQALLVALRDESSTVSHVAAEALGNIGDPRAIEPLVVELAKNHYAVQRSAKASLDRIDPNWIRTDRAKASVPSLMSMLMHKYWGVRGNSAEVLGNIGDSRAIEPLLMVLRDEHWYVRCAAARALGTFGDRRAVEPLVAALRDKDEHVRTGAATALGKIGDPRAIEPLVLALIDNQSDVRDKVEKALETIDPNWVNSEGAKAAIPSLVVRLTDKDGRVRSSVGDVLKQIDPEWLRSDGTKEAVLPLMTALADKDGEVRKNTVKLLGEIRDSRAVEPLVALLKDTDQSVREESAQALGRIGDPRAIEPLIVAVTHSNTMLQWESVERLLNQIDPNWTTLANTSAAILSLVLSLANPSSSVRQSVENALVKIDPNWLISEGARQAVTALVLALWNNLDEAKKTLDRIDPSWANLEEAKAAIPILVTWLEHKDRFVRFRAARALAEIGDARAIDPLVAALMEVSADAIAKERWVRCEAVKGLGKIKDPRAVEALVVALTDKESNVRRDAARGLGRIGDSRAIDPLVAAIVQEYRGLDRDLWGDVQDSVMNALDQIDPNWKGSDTLRAALPSIAAKLTDKESFVRLKAAEALGKIGDPRAIKQLVAVLADEDGGVRWYAVKALEQIDANWADRFRATVPSLVPKLTETDSVMRRAAAALLGKIGDPRAIEPLIAVLKDKDAQVGIAAVKALAEIGGPHEVAELVTSAYDQSWEAQSSIDQLSRLIETSARTVSKEALIAITNLRDVTQRKANTTIWGGLPDGRSSDDLHADYNVDVDCSRVRELALQELKRRARESGDRPSLYVVGDRLAGRWEVLGVCGGKDRSGMGVVYIVRDSLSDQTEAAKTFQHDLKKFDGLRQALRQEAELWIRLGKHPNIVRARKVETMGDQLYIFMEFVAPDRQGRNSLRHYLKDGPVPEDDFIKWAIQACRGMAHAHSKGVEGHRDIKPDNLMISASGDLKITDFGLAKAYANVAGAESASPATGIFTSGGVEAPGLTCTNVLVGTPGYIAPEIVSGNSGDIRGDIYSFGLVFYQMLTGGQRPPLTAVWKDDLLLYERETLELRRTHQFPAMPSKFEAIVAKCLRFSPSDRFQNFSEMLAEFQSLSRTTLVEAIEDEQLSSGEIIDHTTALINLGQLEEALESIRQAKDVHPHNSGVWNSEGVILTDMRRYDEALSCLDKSIELSPDWVVPWNNKGRALRKMGRSAEALVCYENAIQHDPHHVPPWASKGNCLQDLGRNQEALEAYEQAIQIDENWADAWVEKGRALVKLDRLPQALESLRRALELAPQNEYAQQEYQQILGEQPTKDS